MKRGTEFPNSKAVEKALDYGCGVVVVPASTGGVEAYDDSKRRDTHQRDLDLNLAGAKAFHGNNAFLITRQ